MMTKKKGRSDVLLLMLARRVGPLPAMRVCSFVAAWGAVYEKLDRPPASVEEFAPLAGLSLPTAYREQRLFRQALPPERTPTRVWEAARSRIDPDDAVAAAQLACLKVTKLALPE